MNIRKASFPLLIFSTAFLMNAAVEQEALAAERLTASQMDTITAGTLAVAVAANAQVKSNSSTYAYTQTETRAYSMGGMVEIGIGSGVASAYSSSSTSSSTSSITKARVSTGVYVDGENVLITRGGLNYSTAESSFAYGGITAVSFNCPPIPIKPVPLPR